MLIDSLLLTLPEETESNNEVLYSLQKGLDSNSIILWGLASREHPLDTILQTYVLAIQSDLSKIQLIQIEDSIFKTPFGNYFAESSYPITRRDKFKYLLSNLNKSPSIQKIKSICVEKKEIRIVAGALLDQIPLNVILSYKGGQSEIYQTSFLADAPFVNSDRKNNESYSKEKILLVGGINFKPKNSELTRSFWNYLPGTLDEVNFIKDIFQNRYQHIFLKDSNATKTNFIFQVSHSSYKIIHLATHSFYIDFNSSKNPFTKIPISILPQRELRSAILFAQGSEFEKFESIDRLKTFVEKNLLLGEVLHLPLEQTELVVLSSCETNVGLPEVYNDVYGNLNLNTAFKYAGAKHVIGTRWEVSDRFSKIFYSYFYKNLSATDNIEQSFTTAIKDLRVINSDPYVWGAFTLIK